MPQGLEALVLLAETRRREGRLDEARQALIEAIAAADYLPRLHAGLGVVEFAAGRAEAAASAFAAAIALDPYAVDHRHNLARAWVAADHPFEAAETLAALLCLVPDSAGAWGDLSGIQRDCARLGTALSAAARALHLRPGDPAARWNRALALLQSGDFTAGFAEYESRWSHGPFAGGRRHADLPEPDPKALAGRSILVWCEQGIGDAIQFARYVPLLIGAGAKVVLEAPSKLHALFATLQPALRLVAPEDMRPESDAAIAIGSLPRLFSGRIPDTIPYLRPDPAALAHWRGHLAQFPGRRIGIAWQGNPAGSIDRGRSIPLIAFKPLAELEDCRLIVLQKQHGMEQIATLPFSDRLSLIPDLDSGGHAFRDTAALISALDLVVTSDTSIAHLAGALGARCFLGLKQAPDWRWLMAGDSSPWYPGMTIFRQTRRGDWDDVLNRIAGAVRSLT